jgi:hypothetical protein
MSTFPPRSTKQKKGYTVTSTFPLIYPPELEVKETTDTASSASFLDLYLEFDDSGQLSTNIYDKTGRLQF